MDQQSFLLSVWQALFSVPRCLSPSPGWILPGALRHLLRVSRGRRRWAGGRAAGGAAPASPHPRPRPVLGRGQETRDRTGPAPSAPGGAHTRRPPHRAHETAGPPAGRAGVSRRTRAARPAPPGDRAPRARGPLGGSQPAARPAGGAAFPPRRPAGSAARARGAGGTRKRPPPGFPAGPSPPGRAEGAPSRARPPRPASAPGGRQGRRPRGPAGRAVPAPAIYRGPLPVRPLAGLAPGSWEWSRGVGPVAQRAPAGRAGGRRREPGAAEGPGASWLGVQPPGRSARASAPLARGRSWGRAAPRDAPRRPAGEQ